jgi:hypothetical protein
VVVFVSLEDIFLFKAVAGQVGDIEKVDSLIQTGLEFDVAEAEFGDSMGACLAQESVSPSLKSRVEAPVLTYSG